MRTRRAQCISFGRCLFSDSIAPCRQFGKSGFTIRISRFRLNDGTTTIQQLKDCPFQSLTACSIFLDYCKRTIRQFKSNRSRLVRPGSTSVWNDNLLQPCCRDADHEKSLFIRCGQRFCFDCRIGCSGSDRNLITTEQVVISVIRSTAVTGHGAILLFNANPICIRRKCGAIDVFSTTDGSGLVCYVDLTGDRSSSNCIVSQPTGVCKVFFRRGICPTVERIKIPVISNKLAAFQFLDHLTNSKLTRCTAPVLIVSIVQIQYLIRIGMAHHPCNGVHGSGRKDGTGLARSMIVRFQINDRIGTSLTNGAIISAFTGSIEHMLQTVNCHVIKVVGCCIYSTVIRRSSQLFVAIVTGTTVYTSLTDSKTAKVCIYRLERRDKTASHCESSHHGNFAHNFIFFSIFCFWCILRCNILGNIIFFCGRRILNSIVRLI